MYLTAVGNMAESMNQLSIQLSNDAMARGLQLAQQRGVASLEELIELLLQESTTGATEPPAVETPDRTRGAGPARRAPGAASTAIAATTEPGEPSAPPDFNVNPPAISLERVAQPPAALAQSLPESALPLPFLTNRLSPLKASVRALANLAAREGDWPKLRDFQAKAGHAARDWGLKLQAEDRAAGRRARQKRAVAWPIGANPAPALERFAYAFTLSTDSGAPAGPLAVLGLATVTDGRAALTHPGWQLATAPSPVLDGGEGTLSSEEITILRGCLLHSVAERDAIAEFVRAVRRSAGVQPRIDELFSVWHAEWSADQAAAQRSAMIGRLEELELLEVSGRGSKAIVTLKDLEGIEQFANQGNHGSDT
jgi:hypothetical protein